MRREEGYFAAGVVVAGAVSVDVVVVVVVPVVSVPVVVVDVVAVDFSSTTAGACAAGAASGAAASFFWQPAATARTDAAAKPRVRNFFISLISFFLKKNAFSPRAWCVDAPTENRRGIISKLDSLSSKSEMKTVRSTAPTRATILDGPGLLL
jgi:hypothetical protein